MSLVTNLERNALSRILGIGAGIGIGIVLGYGSGIGVIGDIGFGIWVISNRYLGCRFWDLDHL